MTQERDETAAEAGADETETAREEVGDDGGDDGTSVEDDARSGWSSFAEIQETVADLVDTAIRNVYPQAGRHPRYDLLEVPGEGYRVLFDLPGLEKNDVEVSATEGELVVQGTRARPELSAGAEVHRSERPYGRFRRAVRLPRDVRVDGISARMKEGVLEVTLPRQGEGEAQRVVVE